MHKHLITFLTLVSLLSWNSCAMAKEEKTETKDKTETSKTENTSKSLESLLNFFKKPFGPKSIETTADKKMKDDTTPSDKNKEASEDMSEDGGKQEETENTSTEDEGTE